MLQCVSLKMKLILQKKDKMFFQNYVLLRHTLKFFASHISLFWSSCFHTERCCMRVCVYERAVWPMDALSVI